MFYNIVALTYNNSTLESGTISQMMGVGMYVTAIFSCIFLFYTNSFLVKKRKKEFGLYNILGMQKKHIGIIMAYETAMVGGFSILSGIGVGVLFNKLITLLLYKLLHFSPGYEFQFSPQGVELTAMLFGGIFVLMLISSIGHIHTSNPAELLGGGNVGEREPKTKWAITVIGVVCLGLGYAISLCVESPMAAIGLFFVAVVLVIIGTYCLFIAGSIAALKLLKKNRRYYYRTNHFTSVSGMIYRMKQNAVGLANICILSTMVLVLISSCVSLYLGVEDIMVSRYPTDIGVNVRYTPEGLGGLADKEKMIAKTVADAGHTQKNYSRRNLMTFFANRNGNILTHPETGSPEMTRVISAQEYERITGEKANISGSEVLVGGKNFEKGDMVEIFGIQYQVAEFMKKPPTLESDNYIFADKNYIVVGSDEDMKKIYYAGSDNGVSLEMRIGFDVEGSDDEKMALAGSLNEMKIGYVDSRQASKADFYTVYGGLLFLGIFLGGVFSMATVLIIYYKQVAEGNEDKDRFDIMQKVGMSSDEVKRTIHSQVLTVFALPLCVAAVHMAVAFPILAKLLKMMNLVNVSLFGICTVITTLVFALIYAAVYFLTAKVYYKTVRRS